MLITVSRLTRNLYQIFIVIFTTIPLVACGGGGSSGSGGTSLTTLFEDTFDFSVSGSKWTMSGVGASGTVEHDPTEGFPDAGSMKMSGESRAQAFASSFSVANGVQIYVRVLIPDSTVIDSSTHSGLMIEIESTELGTGNALVRIWRSPCIGIAPTSFEYFIEASTLSGTGGNTQGSELFSCGFEPRSFVDFAFIVHPDGSSEWQRDGITMLSFGSHFGSGGVKLNLHGGGLDTGSLPGFYLWYDDVWVVK